MPPRRPSPGLARALRGRSRPQAGCLSAVLLRLTGDSNRILFIEGWRDPAALDAHRDSAMMAQAPGTHQDWYVSRKITRCLAD